MNKRIKKKKQNSIWKSPVVALERYHCVECNKDFLAQVHEKMMEETLVYLENNKIFCPICGKELKLKKQFEQEHLSMLESEIKSIQTEMLSKAMDTIITRSINHNTQEL